ncbi:hypothetical protein [Ruegeria atlantica]|uniref:Mannosyltransferase OCH1 n=1 Tax=Ruegeria atlantica TaxID=81569 RepID=A0A0P1E8N5_9RHOB|nr:hypothetical protein [Ruegeria atlantica]CUH45474.1 hypothetical protein RUM4293_04390 [Ruegeria atlantica]
MERVATLWIGERLSYLERLCLKSFADVDQKPILYHYGELQDIPDYVEARDAREIFDTPELYRDPVQRSVAVHSDLFRLKLLQKTDFIWVDADAYAVKPFVTNAGYLFPHAHVRHKRINSGVLSLPSDSPALKNMCEFAFQSDLIPPWWPEERQNCYIQMYGRSTLWSLPIFTFGPPMLFHFIQGTDEQKMQVHRLQLYSIPLRFRNLWNDPDISKLDKLDWQNKTSIHFYGSWFRKLLAGKQINAGSLLDVLLKKHAIDPSAHPL